MNCPQDADAYYSSSVFIPLYQLQLFKEQELRSCYSAPSAPVDNRPRWQRSPVWKQAEDLAWTFRQLFHPRATPRDLPLRPLWIQAFRMFRKGFTAQEIEQAMREAAARGPRVRPQNLWFFVFGGWIRRLRSFKDRMVREVEARERRWEDEKRGYAVAARSLWGISANAEGPVALKDLLAGLVPAMRGAP